MFVDTCMGYRVGRICLFVQGPWVGSTPVSIFSKQRAEDGGNKKPEVVEGGGTVVPSRRESSFLAGKFWL